MAYTEHPGGSISANETWGPGTHYVAGDITVSNGVVLTIQPGSVVKFNNGVGFTVIGSLNAEGEATNPIVMTSKNDGGFGESISGSSGTPAAGDWDGIFLNGFDNQQGIGEFNHCRIRFGGNGGGSADSNVHFSYSDSGHFANSISEFSAQDGIRIANCSPEISESEIRNSTRYGLYAFGTGAPVLTGNNFTFNGDHAVNMATSIVPPGVGVNAGSDNGTNGVVLTGTVNQDQSWSFGGPGFPIVLTADMSVNNGVTLTILAGAVIKFGAGAQLTVIGRLDVNGTADQEVVFTSLKDDSYEGDTNADGDLTTPAPGDWDGILLNGLSTSQGIGEFDHCRIRYGGNAAGYPISNVYFYQSDSGRFANSISEYSFQDGIRVSNSNPDVVNATIVNNGRYGLYCYNCSARVLNAISWNNATGQIYSNLSNWPEVGYSDIQGGYPGDGNIDLDPLFVDIAQGDYLLRRCSPCIDRGDPVEVLTADYRAGDLAVAVDDVTNVEPNDLLWISDGKKMASDVVAGIASTVITLESGFSDNFRVADGAHVFTYKSDYTQEPAPNGRRINMGAYGGSALAASCPCDGDFEPDGDIDGDDLSAFSADYDQTDCTAAGGCVGDFDGDGDVDADDLEAFASNFGKPDCHKTDGG
jgi:hypothetical protein